MPRGWNVTSGSSQFAALLSSVLSACPIGTLVVMLKHCSVLNGLSYAKEVITSMHCFSLVYTCA